MLENHTYLRICYNMHVGRHSCNDLLFTCRLPLQNAWCILKNLTCISFQRLLCLKLASCTCSMHSQVLQPIPIPLDLLIHKEWWSNMHQLQCIGNPQGTSCLASLNLGEMAVKSPSYSVVIEIVTNHDKTRM